MVGVGSASGGVGRGRSWSQKDLPEVSVLFKNCNRTSKCGSELTHFNMRLYCAS